MYKMKLYAEMLTQKRRGTIIHASMLFFHTFAIYANDLDLDLDLDFDSRKCLSDD